MTLPDFKPGEGTIKVCETILWKNNSKVMHTVTFDPEKASNKSHVMLPNSVEPFGSGELNPGEEFQYKFKVPGVYKYFCIPHEQIGMTGKVIVRENN